MSDVFANLRTEPYWWDDAPRPDVVPEELPGQVDAVVIGSGFSGLCAARVLGRAGKSVLLCESGSVGQGASTRNGGMLGPSFHKLGVAGLKARYGEERTNAMLSESIGFMDFVGALTAEENIDCEFHRSGRFRCASRPAHYEQMARSLEPLRAATDLQAEMIPASRSREEIGSDLFSGGVLYHRDGGLHPAKYHDGMVRVVQEAGGVISPQTEVTRLVRNSNGFAVTTSRGLVQSGQVAVCTNGYTGSVTPWFRRRIVPIRSTIIATEELPGELLQRLMPTRRMYGDSRRVMAYYRPSPDGKRILFGGRAAGSDDRPAEHARDLRRFLVDIYPELRQTQITHVWSGLVAYTFDHAPHLGHQDDLYYAMGYCGSGVARSSFFGHKLGHKMLGNEEGATAFDDLPFETRPLYNGNPWFMPAVIQWHRMIDRLGF